MTYLKILNQLTKLLNSLEKEYTIRIWGSGDGVDIVIPHNNGDMRQLENKTDYNIIISINDDGYVDFEHEELEEIKESNGIDIV